MQVVVLPGLDGTGNLLAEFAEHLSKHFPTTTIAYPGNRPLHYSELADLVEAKLPLDSKFALIAESFSGPIATLLAARHPTGLSGIAYVASFVCRPIRVPKFMATTTRLLPLKWRALLWLMRPLTFGRWASEANGTDLANAMACVDHRVLVHRIKAILQADCRAEFASLELPMLYLRPSGDRLVLPSSMLEMGRLNPALMVREIKGPHFVLQTRAAEAAAVIKDFLWGLEDDTTGCPGF